MYNGAIHIHSRYSDGDLSLAELRDAYAAAGCAFVCMTDHAEFLDEDGRRRYVSECAALSDERFRFIGFRNAGDQRTLLGTHINAQLDQLARIGHFLGRQHLGGPQFHLHEIVYGDPVVAGGGRRRGRSRGS